MLNVKTDMQRWSPSCRSVHTNQAIADARVRTGSGRACAPGPAGPSWQRVAVRDASNCRRELDVLPAPNRLRSSAEFAATISHGVRVGRPTLVVHAQHFENDDATPQGNRVGFVVSKAVGGAVVRNRVKRRLRALARPLAIDQAAQGFRVVVRALPAAAKQPARLGDDLADAWAAATAKAVAT